jgi:hypothetical protein
METTENRQVLELVKMAHDQVENLYLENPVGKDSPDWLNKRRLLLADLALHLVQAALKGDKLDTNRLRRYLFSILTIAHDFIPEAELTGAAEKLMAEPKLQSGLMMDE